MTAEELRSMLEGCTTPLELCGVEAALRQIPSEVVFHLLFPIATTYVGRVDALAASLLVELEPPCPLGCEDALRMLASGCSQLSDPLVPFYLVTQFGKNRLRDAVKSVAAEIKGESSCCVTTVDYWTRFPTLSTINNYRSLRTQRYCAAALEWHRQSDSALKGTPEQGT